MSDDKLRLAAWISEEFRPDRVDSDEGDVEISELLAEDPEDQDPESAPGEILFDLGEAAFEVMHEEASRITDLEGDPDETPGPDTISSRTSSRPTPGMDPTPAPPVPAGFMGSSSPPSSGELVAEPRPPVQEIFAEVDVLEASLDPASGTGDPEAENRVAALEARLQEEVAAADKLRWELETERDVSRGFQARFSALQAQLQSETRQGQRAGERLSEVLEGTPPPGSGTQAEVRQLRNQVRDLEEELEMRMQVMDGLRADYQAAPHLQGEVKALQTQVRELEQLLEEAEVELSQVRDPDGLRAQIEERDHELRLIHEELQEVTWSRDAEHRRTQELESALRFLKDPGRKKKQQVGILAGLLLAAGLGYFGARWKAPSAPTSVVKPPPPQRTPREQRKPTPPPEPRSGKAAPIEVLEEAARNALEDLEKGKHLTQVPELAFRADLGPRASLVARLARGESVVDVREEWAEELAREAQTLAQRSRLYARALLREGLFPEAKAELERTLEMNPEDVLAQLFMAEVRLGLGEVEGLFEKLEALSVPSEDSPRLAWLKGRARLEEGDFDSALAYLLEAVTSQPDSFRFRLSLVEAYRGSKDPEHALENLEVLRRERPDHPRVHWLMAEALEDLGRDEEAKSEKERALRLGYRPPRFPRRSF